MNKPGINLQDSFLNQVRKDNTNIVLMLLDGTRLTGQVRGFDNFTVIVQNGTDQHLIYKHAIAHIVHHRSAARYPDREGEGHHERKPRPPRVDNRARPQDSRPADKARPAPSPNDSQAKAAEKEKAKFNTLDLSDVKIN